MILGCNIDSDMSDIVIEGEATGLLGSIAYAILDIIFIKNPKSKNVTKKQRLLRLKNFWDGREFIGKWSRNSPELLEFIDLVKLELDKTKHQKFDFKNYDGTFLMSFKEFRKIFTNLFIIFDQQNWGLKFEGNWTVENSGGVPKTRDQAVNWAKNPQYIIEINTKSEVFINLSQSESRYIKNSSFPFDGIIKNICFAVMKIHSDEETIDMFDKSKVYHLSVLKQHKDVSCKIELLPGKYVIVPSTLNTGETGKF